MLEIEATGQDGKPTRPYVINVVRSEPDLTIPRVRDRYFKDSLIQLDIEGVRRAIEAGSDINQPLEHRRGQLTPLMASIAEEHTDMARQLINSSADPNLSLPEDAEGIPAGTSPLLLALAQGQNALVPLLIERGADVDAVVPVPDPRTGPEGSIVFEPPFRWPSNLLLPGMTALLLAINDGNEQNIGLLLKGQANPNRPLPLVEPSIRSGRSGELSGASPLMLAILKGPDDIVGQLIDHGADVNYAIPVPGGSSGPDGTVIYEPPFREPSKVFLPGLTALLLAVAEKREESLRLLLEAEADPNKTFPLTEASVHDSAAEQVSGVSPLIMAAGIENTAIVKALIEAGADLDYEIPEHPKTGGMFKNATIGVSALKVARAKENEEIIQMLGQAE